jgi:hypothetical protein
MRYVILLWGDAEAEAAIGPAARRAIVDAHMAFADRLRAKGALVLGEPLSAGGKLVREERVVSDGPFVETKEQLGGIYVVDVESEDDAIAIAHELPRSPGLVAEVRATAGG